MHQNNRFRAVWSLWTKPLRAHTGLSWVSERQYRCAWVLSVETARQHYPETCLYTDDAGVRLLVDDLGLEFAHVSTALNALEQHDPDWWALGKVYTYRLQTEPFVHLDNDVFLWKPLPMGSELAPLLAQNPEIAPYYRPEAFERVLRQLSHGWLPDEWLWYRSTRRASAGANCGVFGGNQIDFIHYYADLAIRLIEHPSNQRGWSLLRDKSGYNTLFEQYLLSACIEYQRNRAGSTHDGIEIQYLFDSLNDALKPENAARIGFTHLLGGAKRNPTLAGHLENRVQHDYPEQYRRCARHLGVLG